MSCITSEQCYPDWMIEIPSSRFYHNHAQYAQYFCGLCGRMRVQMCFDYPEEENRDTDSTT